MFYENNRKGNQIKQPKKQQNKTTKYNIICFTKTTEKATESIMKSGGNWKYKIWQKVGRMRLHSKRYEYVKKKKTRE
jgi:hypothetical protein